MNLDNDEPIRFDRNQTNRRRGLEQFTKLMAMFFLAGVFISSSDLIATSSEYFVIRDDKWAMLWLNSTFAILLVDLAQAIVFGSHMFSSLLWLRYRTLRMTILATWFVGGIAAIAKAVPA